MIGVVGAWVRTGRWKRYAFQYGDVLNRRALRASLGIVDLGVV